MNSLKYSFSLFFVSFDHLQNKKLKRTAILFSGISHFIYGILTFSLPFYKAEFIRYGEAWPKISEAFNYFRELIGGVQIVFGICLLIGLYSYKSDDFQVGKALRLFSSLALSLLMGGALATRIYIGDGLLETAPSLFYLIINLFIFIDVKNFKR